MLKDIPGIFKDNDDSDEGNENEDATGENKSEDNQPPKKKGRWGNLLFLIFILLSFSHRSAYFTHAIT